MRRREKLAAVEQREEELRRAAEARLALGSARAAAVAAERHEVAVLARVKHAVGAARKVEAVRQRATLEEAEKVGGHGQASRQVSSQGAMSGWQGPADKGFVGAYRVFWKSCRVA